MEEKFAQFSDGGARREATVPGPAATVPCPAGSLPVDKKKRERGEKFWFLRKNRVRIRANPHESTSNPLGPLKNLVRNHTNPHRVRCEGSCLVRAGFWKKDTRCTKFPLTHFFRCFIDPPFSYFLHRFSPRIRFLHRLRVYNTYIR